MSLPCYKKTFHHSTNKVALRERGAGSPPFLYDTCALHLLKSVLPFTKNSFIVVIVMSDVIEAAKKLDVKGIIISSIITSLGLIIALFWNDAIRSAIETIIKPGDKLSMKFYAAIIVTIISAFVIYIIYKLDELSRKHKKKIEVIIKKRKALIK